MLSIILPSIRTRNISQLINSIDYDDYELIIVGPTPICELYDYIIQNNLQYKVKIITDWGSPVRCIQIGLNFAVGDIVTIFADDQICYSNQIQNVLEYMSSFNNYKTIIVCRYTEANSKWHQPTEYYYLDRIDNQALINIPKNWFKFNVQFIYRKYLEELGGYDCMFDTQSWGLAQDFAIRAYLDGANVCFYDNCFCHFEWDAISPEHQPMANAHSHDIPIYVNKPKTNNTCNISLDNWKQSDKVWLNRFNNLPKFFNEYNQKVPTQ